LQISHLNSRITGTAGTDSCPQGWTCPEIPPLVVWPVRQTIGARRSGARHRSPARRADVDDAIGAGGKG